MAAAQLNRIAYCMELDPKYASVILRRYADTYGSEDITCKRGKKTVRFADVVKEVSDGKQTA